MKTLDEHNDEAIRFFINEQKKDRAGVACPTCGNELIDSWRGSVLACDPPKKDVHCDKCGYKGYKYL